MLHTSEIIIFNVHESLIALKMEAATKEIPDYGKIKKKLIN